MDDLRRAVAVDLTIRLIACSSDRGLHAVFGGAAGVLCEEKASDRRILISQATSEATHIVSPFENDDISLSDLLVDIRCAHDESMSMRCQHQYIGRDED